jgi:hypothetical protein
MGVIGKDFKYKLIENFLDKNEVFLLSSYCDFFHKTNQKYFCGQSPAKDTGQYGNGLMESLLLLKKSKMEEHTGLKLLPTYSYWRLYTYKTFLEIHKDRPSCEISTTVHIAGDTEWPIYMDGTPVITKPGDAVIYLGPELKHYRNTLEGEYQTQCFLHYVNADGPYKEFDKDKRPAYGLPEEFRN